MKCGYSKVFKYKWFAKSIVKAFIAGCDRSNGYLMVCRDRPGFVNFDLSRQCQIDPIGLSKLALCSGGDTWSSLHLESLQSLAEPQVRHGCHCIATIAPPAFYT